MIMTRARPPARCPRRRQCTATRRPCACPRRAAPGAASRARCTPAPRLLVRLDDAGRPLALRDLDPDDLALELARLLRGERAPVRLGREGVLILPRDALLLRAQLAAVAHVDVLVRVPQAVLNERV